MSSGERRRARWVVAGPLVGLIVAGAPVRAQEARLQAPASTPWADALAAQLKLDAPQQAAFRDYETAFDQKSGSQVPAPGVDQLRAMTMPLRMDYMADRIAADLKIIRAQATASHRLYDLLSADQRKLFDERTMPRSHASRAAVVSHAQNDKPDYSLPSHTNPAWLVQPSADEIGRVYPSAARQRNLDGETVISCGVDPDGYLMDCIVDSETPKDEGFGNAALEITAYMRFQPATNFGVPVYATVRFPVHFKLDHSSY